MTTGVGHEPPPSNDLDKLLNDTEDILENGKDDRLPDTKPVEHDFNSLVSRIRALEESLLHDAEQAKLLPDEEDGNNVYDDDDDDDDEESLQKNPEKKDTDSDTHEHYESQFNEDTFSFMIVSKPLSVPYITGLLMFALKTSIYCLVLANVIEWNAKFNKLNVPVNVSAPVVISQFIAFGITVFTQDDLIMVMILLYEGYKDVHRSLPQVTLLQWMSAVLFCSIDASLGLFATFVLVVNSDTVLDVLLNFAAVEFVSQLDNTAFDLSTKGFMGRINQLEAMHIQELEYTVHRKAQAPGFIRVLGMAFVLLIVGATWCIVYVNQIEGRYAIGNIHIQFDDSTRPGLATHNGFYQVATSVRITPGGTRFFYREERDNGKGEFAFCRRSSRWAFFVEGGDPCSKTGILAQATKIGTFQLTDTASLPWFATRPDSFDRIEMPEYQLTDGCQLDTDCGTDAGSFCRRNRCICGESVTGYQCDYPKRDLCERVEIDAFTGNAFSSQRTLATTYHLMNGTEAYNRPVYLSTNGDLLLYTGLRWAITTINDEGFGARKGNVTALLEFIGTDSFHSSIIHSVDMLSEPVWFSTTSDKFMDPRELQWYHVIGRQGMLDINLTPRPDRAVLLCAICNNNTNPCLNGNTCNAAGKCECRNGETGPLCQIPPTGDGKCDQFFNNAEFNYDGGDCCRPTCKSSLRHQCGTIPEDDHEEEAQIRIGYPFCRDPEVLSEITGLKYIIQTTPILPDSTKEVAPVLSGNGRILVLAEPVFDAVRVFDRITNEWVERAAPLEGVLRSRFGESIDMSTVPGTISGRRRGLLPMLLAISSRGDFPLVYVYDWPQGASRWTLLPRIDLRSDGLCLGICGVTVKAGVRQNPDQTRVAAVVVNVAEQGESKNNLYVRGTDISRTIGWRRTPLVNADLVSVSLTGRYIMLFNVSSADFLVYDHEADLSYNGTITMPAEFRSQPNVTLTMEAMQLSGNSRNFGCIFRVSNGSTQKAFMQHYFTGLFDGRVPRMDSQYEIPFEFSVARFSNEGDASAAVLTQRDSAIGTDVFRVLQLDPVTSIFETFEPVSTTDINMQQTSPTYASISHDGASLAVGGMSTTQVVSRPQLCEETEETFRFFLRTGSSPHELSWELSTIRTLYGSVVTNKMIHQCNNCYVLESFARSEVAELYCIPREERRCLRFNFLDDNPPLEPNTGYNAFLIEPTSSAVWNPTLFELADGHDGDATTTVVVNSSTCVEQPPSLGCAEHEEEFLVRFVFDNFPQGIEWEVSGDNVLWQGGNYTQSDAVSVRMERRCLPMNGCFNFTVVDSFGDGLCCDTGYGEFVGFFGKKEVFRGGNFMGSESKMFGLC